MTIPVTSLGQCGFRFELGSTVIYTDPYLSNQVAEVEGQEFDRLLPIPVAPAEVKDADFVLITHAHMDHCDIKTLVPMAAASPTSCFICPNEVEKVLVNAGIEQSRIIVANKEWIDLGDDARVMPVPAAHPEVEYDEERCLKCVGYVIEFNNRRLYHAGDGSPDELVFKELKKLEPIDIAFIPVNEKNYYRDKLGIIGNMSVREAFQMAMDIGVKTLVPTHWDMFALNNVYRDEIELLYKLESPSFDMKLNPEEL